MLYEALILLPFLHMNSPKFNTV